MMDIQRIMGHAATGFFVCDNRDSERGTLLAVLSHFDFFSGFLRLHKNWGNNPQSEKFLYFKALLQIHLLRVG